VNLRRGWRPYWSAKRRRAREMSASDEILARGIAEILLISSAHGARRGTLQFLVSALIINSFSPRLEMTFWPPGICPHIGRLEGEGEQDDADDEYVGALDRVSGTPPDRPMQPERERDLYRLALAALLVVIVGASLGLDAAMAVAFSLAVMEAARMR
jgi:hypothetical protein